TRLRQHVALDVEFLACHQIEFVEGAAEQGARVLLDVADRAVSGQLGQLCTDFVQKAWGLVDVVLRVVSSQIGSLAPAPAPSPGAGSMRMHQKCAIHCFCASAMHREFSGQPRCSVQGTEKYDVSKSGMEHANGLLPANDCVRK